MEKMDIEEDSKVETVKGAKAKEAELRAQIAPMMIQAKVSAKVRNLISRKIIVVRANQIQKKQSGNIKGALEILMKWEKKARLAMIHVVTKDVALEMLKLCHDAKDWTSYNSTLVHISKRRQQHSSVIKACVEVAISLVDKTPDRQTKLTFVKTLRDVTEGKIFLEVQRARLTRRLASMKEEDSELDEASSIMQEVQVETFGTMENAEKVEFILE